jgi:hypothetical protein
MVLQLQRAVVPYVLAAVAKDSKPLLIAAALEPLVDDTVHLVHLPSGQVLY